MRAQPNVIVFFTDQQRWDSVGLHGNPMQLTPNFDRLAKAGTFIPNSFTCQPVCGPARSAFQTGKYPTKTGCYRNSIPLPQDEKTLAHHFKAGGYETAYIGKWHLAEEEPVPKPARGGYEYWLASNLLEFTSYAYDTVLYNGENEPVKLPGYRVDALTDAAIRYIDQEHEKPFFLYLSYIEPHHQNQSDSYPAPFGYEERIRKNMQLPPDLQALGGTSQEHYPGYMGMIERLDEAFGRMVEALASLDMLDNTIILFSSDHGCHFKTRNGEYKRSCHEASIRVPTLFHGPGFTGAGSFDGLVSLIDLPPTLLDAAGLPVPEGMQGRSILPRRIKDDPAEDDIFVQVSEDHVGRALRTRRWKYEVTAPDADGWNSKDSQRYVETHLYDLDADPYELDDLAGRPGYDAVRAQLRERLMQRIVAVGESRPEIVPAATL
jgi:arylsulfatase A-like enzyme